jgi:hypothetical protein
MLISFYFFACVGVGVLVSLINAWEIFNLPDNDDFDTKDTRLTKENTNEHHQAQWRRKDV